MTCHLMAQPDDPIELLERGKKIHFNGYYDSAVNVLKKAQALFSKNGQIEKTIETNYALGESYLNIGSCDSAEFYINRGLNSSIGNVAQTADGYYMLARSTGGCSNKWDEAIEILGKSLRIKKELYGEKSDELSLDYNLMGYLNHFFGAYDSALVYLNRALEIRSDNPGIDPVEFSATHFYLGKVYERKGDLKKALKHSQIALNIRQQLLPKNHPSTSNCLDDVGKVYKSFGNFDRALDYLHQGLEIRKQTLGEDHPNVAASYYSIGTLYGNMFNYRRAIYFVEQGNLILRKKYGDQLPVLHTYYAYLGRMHHEAGDAEKAKELLDLSQELSEKYLPPDHPYLAIIYDIIGRYYANKDLLDEQRKYHQKALSIHQKQGKRSIREADVLLKLGEVHLKLSSFDQAASFYDQSLGIYRERLGDKNAKVAALYRYYGDLVRKKGNYQEAIAYYWKVLNALSYEVIDEGDDFDLNSLTHKLIAMRSLHRIVKVYLSLYEDSSEEEFLHESLKYSNKAIELIKLIASEYKLEDSKAQLSKETRSVFSDAIETAFQLFQLTNDETFKQTTYRFIEESKSPILLSRIQENEARQFSNIPDSLLSKERDIRVELSYFKEQLRDAKAANDEEKISFYQNEVFTTQGNYERFKDDLQLQFQEYYAYRYVDKVLDLQQLRNALPANTALLEYFEAEKVIYSVYIDDKSFDILRFPVSDTFYQKLDNYQRSLTDNVFIVNEPKESDSLLVTTGYDLYEALIKPALGQSVEIENLLIIPDGRLSKLSFGTLLTTPADLKNVRYDQLSYLLTDYSISYAYSTRLNFRPKNNSGRLRFAGFAPSYELVSYAGIDSSAHPMAYELVRDGLLPLPGAVAEVQQINEFLNGQIWVNKEASETNFKQSARNYSVIHLAMHSLLNNEEPEYSELLFNYELDSLNDGYLTIDEIYNLDLEVDMIVLSACSSGGGKLQVGEGPISFTRAFSYAGCPSVIMSMWKLPDAATNQITVEFYRNIKAGDPKDLALRKAQLKYLEDTEDPLYQHPFFWGSFVALGDTKPITNSWFDAKLIVYLVSALLIVGWIFRKRIFVANH